jgi:hypothetical protein
MDGQLDKTVAVGWLSKLKIQYARDDEINLNKNIVSEVYCNANEFPNHLLY